MTQSVVTSWRFTSRQTALRLFLTCWLVYSMHFATNIVREIYPAVTLGDHLSFNVQEYLGLHPDIFQPDPNTDRAFINSNPGASIVGAIPYAAARPLIDRVVEAVQRRRAANPSEKEATYASPWPMAREFYRQVRERGLDVKLGLAAGVMQAFAMAPISALSVVVIFWILARLGCSVRTSLPLALLYAFATPVFYRTAQLNQNLLVSHCGLFAFALLWRPWDSPDSPRRPWYLAAGLLCGWAVVCDYSGVVTLAVLASYGLWRRRSLPSAARGQSDALRFVAGVAVSIAVLMFYQWSSFGNPILPAQAYIPVTNFADKRGFYGFELPQPDLLWATAFDLRYGLFTSAPLLLLTFWAPAWFRRRGALVEKREAWCILALFVAFMLFCGASQRGRMQFNSGVRHVVPVTPFLFLIAAGILIRLPTTLAVIVGVLTTYWSWCLAMYRDVERGLGIPESLLHVTFGGFQIPWLTTLERMGAQFPRYFERGASAVPLLALAAACLWALWGTGAAHSARR